MYRDDRFNPWVHYHKEAETYTLRAEKELDEMTCHAQAAEVLAEFIEPGDSLMDVGCATGYTYWSFKDRGLDIDYHGIDITPRFIDTAHEVFCPLSGTPPDNLTVGAAETLEGRYDIVVCVNTLYCLPNFHQPLDKMCAATKKALFIRTLLDDQAEYRYPTTDYEGMDPQYRYIKAYYNIYPINDVMDAIADHGLEPRHVVDQRTGDQDEHQKGVRYPWKCILAVRP